MTMLIAFVIFVFVVACLYALLKWGLPKMGIDTRVINIILVVFVILAVLLMLMHIAGYGSFRI